MKLSIRTTDTSSLFDIDLSPVDWTRTRASVANLVRAASLFLRGEAVSPRPEIDALMWELLQLCAASGAGIADETLASAALSEARLEVPKVKFDKRGFAPGVRRDAITKSLEYLRLYGANARLIQKLSRKRTPSVGVLKEG